MAFGLQLLRVGIAELFYYLHEVVEAADATLVLIALVVFGATFLAALVWRVGGGRGVRVGAGESVKGVSDKPGPARAPAAGQARGRRGGGRWLALGVGVVVVAGAVAAWRAGVLSPAAASGG